MAIQMWTPFRADQNIMAGADALGGGIRQGLASVGEAFSKAMEEKKRQGQLATSLRKTLKVAYPDRASDFDAMGLPDLQGTLEGEALKSANAKRQAEMQAMQFEQQRHQQMLAQQAAQQRLWQDFGTRGQALEAVPSPVSNAEFDRRTSPLDIQSFMEAVASSGAALKPDDVAAFTRELDRMQPKQVPPFVLPPGFETKSISLDANGQPTMQFGKAPEPKVPTGEYEWLYSDNLDEFKAGVRGIKDAAERARVVAARNDYEQSLGRPSMLERLLMGGGGPAPAGAPQQKDTKETKPKRLRYNVKTGMAEEVKE